MYLVSVMSFADFSVYGNVSIADSIDNALLDIEAFINNTNDNKDDDESPYIFSNRKKRNEFSDDELVVYTSNNEIHDLTFVIVKIENGMKFCTELHDVL